ncbi:MAG: hypothetical protein ACI9RG_000508 [Sulfurimonas sp.]|jgi:hypothetical protein
MNVDLLELKTLATNRAKLLKEYLVKQKGIADNKINLFTVQNVQEEKQS